jgi:hypothetical protein
MLVRRFSQMSFRNLRPIAQSADDSRFHFATSAAFCKKLPLDARVFAVFRKNNPHPRKLPSCNNLQFRVRELFAVCSRFVRMLFAFCSRGSR